MPKEAIKHNVRMLGSLSGVDDGEIYPRNYLKGEVYEIGDDLFKTFKEQGVVELTKAAPTKKAAEASGEGDEGGDDNALRTELEALEDKELFKRAKKAGVKLKGEVTRDDLIEALIKDAE